MRIESFPLSKGEAFRLSSSRKLIARLAASLYFCFALALSVHCYRNSMYDIDVLGFASNVALTDTRDLVEAHRAVYDNLLTPHLRGTDADNLQARVLRRRATDPYYSAMYLPYFSIKPLYVLGLEAAHRFGANVIDASRIISATCYFGIAVILWLYTRSSLTAIVLILPETMVLGQANEPDGMSVMLLLLGLWAVFIGDLKFGTLPLVMAIWVRPDNVILCVAVIAFLTATRRLETWQAAILAALSIASYMLISNFGYGWRSLYFHTFLGGEPGQTPYFTISDYVNALRSGIFQAVHSSIPVYALLFALCLVYGTNGKLRGLLAVVSVSLFAHFLVFPNYEVRYYGLFFVLTAATAICLITRFRNTESAAARVL